MLFPRPDHRLKSTSERSSGQGPRNMQVISVKLFMGSPAPNNLLLILIMCLFKKKIFFTRFGWVDEHFAIVPRSKPLFNCGQNKTGLVTWRAAVTQKFDVFCFSESGVRFYMPFSLFCCYYSFKT